MKNIIRNPSRYETLPSRYETLQVPKLALVLKFDHTPIKKTDRDFFSLKSNNPCSGFSENVTFSHIHLKVYNGYATMFCSLGVYAILCSYVLCGFACNFEFFVVIETGNMIKQKINSCFPQVILPMNSQIFPKSLILTSSVIFCIFEL